MLTFSTIGGTVGGGTSGGGGGQAIQLCTVNVVKPSLSINMISLNTGNNESIFSAWQEITLMNEQAYTNTYVFNTNKPKICEFEDNIITIDGDSQGGTNVRCLLNAETQEEESVDTIVTIRCGESSKSIKINIANDIWSYIWNNPIYLVAGVIVFILLLLGVYSISRLSGGRWQEEKNAYTATYNTQENSATYAEATTKYGFNTLILTPYLIQKHKVYK